MRGAGGAGEGNAAAAAAAAAGANTLAPSAFAEAESLLECLAELMPTLEEAFGLADEVGIISEGGGVSGAGGVLTPVTRRLSDGRTSCKRRMGGVHGWSIVGCLNTVVI